MPRTTDPMKSPHSAISATRIKHAKAATWISCSSRKETKVTKTRARPPKIHCAAERQNLEDIQSRFIPQGSLAAFFGRPLLEVRMRQGDAAWQAQFIDLRLTSAPPLAPARLRCHKAAPPLFSFANG